MEPAFEHLLRTCGVHDSIIWTLRINDICDRWVFCSLDSTEEGLKTSALDLGIDLVVGGLSHKRETARLITAWKQTKAQSDIKLTILMPREKAH